jgi:hypothetical protein
MDDLYFGVRDVVFKAKVFNRHGSFDRIAKKNMENLDYAYLRYDLLNKAPLTPISFKVKSSQIYILLVFAKRHVYEGQKFRH